jgi:hypothetical protein
VQAVGRTLRKNPKNPDKIGYVLLPVLVEDGQTVDEFLESSAFKEVGRVLAVLSTHDERIAEEFRTVEGGKRNTRESRIVFGGDVPVGVRLSAEEFAERCGARVWQRVGRANWRPFKEAREFVCSLELKNLAEWRKYCGGVIAGKPPLPDDVPRDPASVYEGRGWRGIGDWIGSGVVAKQSRRYRSYEAARAFVHSLKLKSGKEWGDYCAGRVRGKPPLPADIPAAVYVIYKNRGWTGMGDWLGTTPGGRAFGGFRKFSEARRFARTLGIATKSEWMKYSKGEVRGKPPIPADIPKHPSSFYQGRGWTSWGDWLGSGTVATFDRTFRTFEDARAYVHRLGLKSRAEWVRYCKGQLGHKPRPPSDVPRGPSRTYRQYWRGWGDWLGTGTVAVFERQYRSFAAARAFVHSLKLATTKEWLDYRSGRLDGKPPKPDDIPTNPNTLYADSGWKGMSDWLGNGRQPSNPRKPKSRKP